MPPRRRLLVVGHGASATGFSRVAHAIIEHLPPEISVEHLAVNHTADRVAGDWLIFGNPRRGDLHGLERLAELVDQRRPDVVLFIGDLWFCAIHQLRLSTVEPRPAVICYCPVDGELTDQASYALTLGRCAHLVVYNDFGLTQITTLWDRLAAAGSGSPRCPVTVIPHGLDLTAFHRMADAHGCRRAGKRAYFGADSPLVDSFIVLNANKNQPRKRLDLTIEGFARFARDKPATVRLYLHTQLRDLPDLARRAGLADRLLTTPGSDLVHPALSDARLNLLYNACDVGVNTSVGEGWGLTSLEHGATGAAQIVPGHSACAALWKGSAALLAPVASYEQSLLGMLHHVVDPADLASCLQRLYADPDLRRHFGQRAVLRCQDTAFDWVGIGRQWGELILSAEPGSPESATPRRSPGGQALTYHG